MQETELEKQAADSHDHSKRQTLQRLAIGAAFVAPLMTSVSMSGLTISKVHAGSAASSAVKEEEKEEEKPVCKEHEVFDEKLKKCVPEKEEEKKCPHGTEWDWKKQECVKKEALNALTKCPEGEWYNPWLKRCVIKKLPGKNGGMLPEF
jgi:hypothetical protein